MGTGLFWGILLVILGISLIFRVVFNINLPVFKLFFAFLFIYIGIRILIGDSFKFNKQVDKNDVIFGEKYYNEFNSIDKEYNVIFGKGVFDLSTVQQDTVNSTLVEFNTVFGSTTIWINRDTPVKVKVEAVFAGARLPNGNSVVFGSNNFVSENFNASKPHLFIKADVVFGDLDIRYK